MTKELNAAWEALQAVEAEVSTALAKAARLAAEAKDVMPEDLIEELSETPIEELLRGMLAAKEQADADRKQVARLIVLVDRLGIQATDLVDKADINAGMLHGLEDGAAVVAGDLATARGKADVTQGEPGAAADEASKTPDT